MIKYILYGIKVNNKNIDDKKSFTYVNVCNFCQCTFSWLKYFVKIKIYKNKILKKQKNDGEVQIHFFLPI